MIFIFFNLVQNWRRVLPDGKRRTLTEEIGVESAGNGFD